MSPLGAVDEPRRIMCAMGRMGTLGFETPAERFEACVAMTD